MKMHINKKNSLILVCLVILAMLTACNTTSTNNSENEENKQSENKTEGNWELVDEIVENVTNNQPEFADYSVDVEDFGGVYLDAALSDSDEDKVKEAELAKANTEALNDAIKAVSEHKDNGKCGGKVIIHKGYFYTAAITLDDNVNLHLDKDAFVMFTTDTTQYPNVLTRWEGVVCYNYSPFIYAYDKTNIAITGEGTFDGQATKEKYWLPWKNGSVNANESQAAAKKKIREMGEEQTPVEERVFGEGSYLRPSFVQPYECEKVLIEGVSIKNAPFWMVHPVFCNNVTIRNVTVNSFGYNNDGINPDSCSNVLIEKCTLNTGDDAIAIKSGLNKDGYTINIPSENIVIRNNTYVTGKGSAATVGSDMSGGIKNIFFMDSQSEDTCNHLQTISIKTNGDRGGTIENIYISGLKSDKVEDYAVYMTMEYEEGDTNKTTPKIHDIYIKDCELSGGSKGTIGMIGYERSPIENIYFENCKFTNCENKLSLWNTKNISFKNCTFDGEKYTDGIIEPVADNILINETTVRGEFITVNYSIPGLESEQSLCWYCSDTEGGEYVPVTENEVKAQYTNFNEAKIQVIDRTKYYKLGIKIADDEKLSDSLHFEQQTL